MNAVERDECFSVDRQGYLVRSVIPARGKPYEHRCPREAFEQIANMAEELGDMGFTLEELAEHAGTPSTQTAVALAFMKERSCVETSYRRSYAAGSCLFEDAMIEYWALAEKGEEV